AVYLMTVVGPPAAPTQLRSFVAGESAANLVNGLSLWSDAASNTTLHLYDAELLLITNLTWNRGHLRSPLSSNRTETFYAASRGLSPGNMGATSSAGVLGTEWSITNVSYTTANYYHLAPSLVNDDLLYLYVSFSPYLAGYYGIAKLQQSHAR